MDLFPKHDFLATDINLLRTGDLADATVNCKGRTWKVHRVLLASRLKFFKAAFYGPFVEAKSGVVNFPEADPDSVDIMLRHLYGEGLDANHMNTAALCVRCWKLADYVQLDTLKARAISSLNDHLDAMAWLASSDLDIGEITPTPKWLGHFFDALQEACADIVTKPLRTAFVAFLWVTRFEMLHLPRTLDILKECPDANQELMSLLVWNRFDNDKPDWIPAIDNIEWDIRNKVDVPFEDGTICSDCDKTVSACMEPMFYNPFPVRGTPIGQMMWCKRCVLECNAERYWPWRLGGLFRRSSAKVEAWSWSDGE